MHSEKIEVIHRVIQTLQMRKSGISVIGHRCVGRKVCVRVCVGVCVKKKGYKDVVVHVSFLQVFHDSVLCDLGQQDHVVHPALFNILTLPVILSLKSHSEQR